LEILCACTTIACGAPLVEVQTITGLRVLGARVHADADSTDASFTPGTGTTLDWLVVADRPTSYSASVRVCQTVVTTTGIPTCSEPPFFERTASFETGTAATFALTPPDLATGSHWLAQLVACGEGRARFAPDGSGRCSAGGEPREATFDGSVAQSNQNPTLQDDLLELDGDAWSEQEPLLTGESCRDEALPRVRSARPAEIGFELGGDDRQELPESVAERYGALQTESLSYSHFLTEPGLERPFSGIASGSDDVAFDLALEFESALPRAGVVADFHLVVRDGRGGSDWIRRQLCALP
jgi:hypothetical protein